MRKLFTLFTILVMTYTGYSQNTNSSSHNHYFKSASHVNHNHDSLERCSTTEHMEWMMQQDPTLKQKMEVEEKKIMDYIMEHYQELTNSKVDYTLPVIVHIVQKTSEAQVTNQQVTEQIAQTNSDWAGTNTRSMASFNSSLKANAHITLCLATKDPQGNTLANPGIHRVTTTSNSFTYDDKVKFTAQGGTDAWDVTKYFNIWVCNLGTSLLGYAQFPTSGINSTYGVVINKSAFGMSGTAQAPFNGGGTLSHEGGHCFNLYHIWGDDSGACTGSDNCADTPNQADATYGNHSGVLTDACTSTSPGIMYMNFMDYSDDADLANVTPNQVTRMQATVANYLSSLNANAANLCSGVSTNPVAAFIGSPTTVPVGGQVTYTSQSTGTISTYNWSFPGGTPSSSTSAGPIVVTYNTAGVYNATLTVGTPTNTLTQTNYINVINCGSNQFAIDFECQADFDITFTPWTVNDVDQGLTYGIEDQAGTPFVFAHSGEAMAYLAFNPASTVPTLSADAELQPHGGDRFGACMNAVTASAPNNDWLISPKVQLGTSSSLTMWVKTYTDTWGLERFKVGVSTTNNSPASFTIISPGSYETAPVTWTQKTYSLANYNNQQVYVGINCVSNDAFIFMVDDININTTLTSLNIVPEVAKIKLFPNPASNYAYIDYSSMKSADLIVEIYDMYGKLVENVSVSDEATSLKKIDVNNLAKGIYLTKIKTPLGEKLEKLIVY